MAIAKVVLAMFSCSKAFSIKDSLSADKAGDPLGRAMDIGSISERDCLTNYALDEKPYQRKYDWTERHHRGKLD